MVRSWCEVEVKLVSKGLYVVIDNTQCALSSSLPLFKRGRTLTSRAQYHKEIRTKNRRPAIGRIERCKSESYDPEFCSPGEI